MDLSITNLTAARGGVALLAAGLLGTNLVENGDFDVPVPSNDTGGGWTSTNIDASGGWRDVGGDRGGVFLVNHAGGSGTDPTLSQTIDGLEPGVEYLVSGDYTSWYLNDRPADATDSFEVDLDGETRVSVGPTGDRAWTDEFCFSFVAETDSVVLAIRGEANGSDNDFAVDNVSLRVADACREDLDGNGVVEFDDLLRLLEAWGPCDACCPEDLDDDGAVAFGDLVAVLSAWGPCPN